RVTTAATADATVSPPSIPPIIGSGQYREGAFGAPSVARCQVGPPEAVPFDDRSPGHGDGAGEHRARPAEGVELASLAHGVDTGRQFARVPGTPRVAGVHLVGIDACDGGPDPGRRHLFGQADRVFAAEPDRKQGIESRGP